MIVSDVLIDVRRELRDTDPNNYRWPDETLWRYLGDAERMIKRWRPDLFLQTNNSMSTTAEYDANDDTLVLSDDERMGLTALVCSRSLGEDADDTVNANRSNDYFVKAHNNLVGGGGA